MAAVGVPQPVADLGVERGLLVLPPGGHSVVEPVELLRPVGDRAERRHRHLLAELRLGDPAGRVVKRDVEALVGVQVGFVALEAGVGLHLHFLGHDRADFLQLEQPLAVLVIGDAAFDEGERDEARARSDRLDIVDRAGGIDFRRSECSCPVLP